MNDRLRAKLNEARERMKCQQAGINMNRKHDDPAMREWARGKLEQIEERIEQLVRENPALSSVTTGAVDSKADPSVPLATLEEYHFLRDMVS
jgi:hypothetical protein